MSGRRSTRKSATSPEESGLVVLSRYGFWYALGEMSFMAPAEGQREVDHRRGALPLPGSRSLRADRWQDRALAAATVEHGEIKVILGSELRAWGRSSCRGWAVGGGGQQGRRRRSHWGASTCAG